MWKKIRKIVYPIIILILFTSFSIIGFNGNLIFSNHQIDNEYLSEKIYMNESRTFYIQFYKYYLITNSVDDVEKYYEYSVESKFITTTELFTGEEESRYYIFNDSLIFDSVNKTYLSIYKGDMGYE